MLINPVISRGKFLELDQTGMCVVGCGFSQQTEDASLDTTVISHLICEVNSHFLLGKNTTEPKHKDQSPVKTGQTC